MYNVVFSNNINFNSRNPQIREFEKPLRILKNTCTTASISKFTRFGCISNNVELKQKLAFAGLTFYLNVRKKISEAIAGKESLEYFKILLKTIKENKLANCAELARLFQLIAGLNGIEVYNATICPSEIDHTVSLIPIRKDIMNDDEYFKKTPLSKMDDVIIVDPWLGIVDYPRNADVKYQCEFSDFIGSPDEFINYDEYIDKFSMDNFYLNPTSCENFKVTQEVREYFIKHAPELFYK